MALLGATGDHGGDVTAERVESLLASCKIVGNVGKLKCNAEVLALRSLKIPSLSQKLTQ